jgi:hypothetical protein
VAEALAPLYGQLNLYNDSALAAAIAAARATDWTVTDANGGRWGVTPGQIHLGKITLPLPFAFSPPPGRRDEMNGRLSGWNAIRRQANQVDAKETSDDRAKAIRERNQAARDSAKGVKKN